MRTILVLAGGHSTDKPVFDTAIAAARPLAANLEFLHVRIGPGEGVVHIPHVEFATGAGLQTVLDDLEKRSITRATAALHHFEELCERESIEIAVSPSDLRQGTLSATWSEEQGNATAKIMRCARHNDLIVLGRHTRSNGLPPDLAERLLVESGRPLLIVPAERRRHLLGTVLICWKETATSARALTAALPLLAVSKHVVIASVQEGSDGSPEALYHLAQRLEWDGISADVRWLAQSPSPVSERLDILADEIGADLLVMGGYGHGRMRAMVFGGCTQRFLDQSKRPVLLMH
ncbi:Universal stress protein family protein [Enhydrobacter aerosaccus]|uniref:Universal stress protein family protein n=1 Tax=Enhydrobacter aerosaccus TaxID=225324 RepID=A0A1T4R9A3_9HYPH|nr:universal stress protein [Enhydrobacter aerosaccus]SKA12497.1 Universal stress protein family protein [Enhydrobacter aerosaccus]